MERRYVILFRTDGKIDYSRVKEEREENYLLFAKNESGVNVEADKKYFGENKYLKYKLVSEKELVIFLMNHDRKKVDGYEYEE